MSPEPKHLSVLPSVVTSSCYIIMSIIMDSGCCSTKAHKWSLKAARYHHGPGWQCRPLRSASPQLQGSLGPQHDPRFQTSTRPPVVTCAMGINTDSGCSRVTDPVMALGSCLELTTPCPQVASMPPTSACSSWPPSLQISLYRT